MRECIKQLRDTLLDSMPPVEADKKVEEVANLLEAIVNSYALTLKGENQ